MRSHIPMVTLALVTALLPCLSIHAADIMVSTPQVAVVIGDGHCSLLEALQGAQDDTTVDACTAGSGDDTIRLEATTYTFTEAANASEFAVAIYGEVTIAGTVGSALDPATGQPIQTRITRAADSLPFNFFLITTSGALTLKDLTLSNGLVSGGGAALANTGTLILENVIITDNISHGTAGGAISNSGALSIAKSQIINNMVIQDSKEARGGGISSTGGTVGIVDSTIANNTITGATLKGMGAGIYSAYTELTINHSIIARNICAKNPCHGGGLYVTGNKLATIFHSTFTENDVSTPLGRGGAIANLAGQVFVSQSSIVKNHATGSGGGIDTLKHSTIPSQTTIMNSTIALNTTEGKGGGLYNVGTTTVKNAVIAENHAAGSPSGGVEGASGTLSLENTLIIGNTYASQGLVLPGDCNGALTSLGHNRIGKSNYGWTGDAVQVASDYLGGKGGNPPLALTSLLGPFVAAQTPGDTHYPLLNIDASVPYALIDAGNVTSCQNETVCLIQQQQGDQLVCVNTVHPLEVDQLGRPRDAACDIGPIEAACGDGIVHANKGEGCDDGNTSDGDGCSAACQVVEVALPSDESLPADGIAEQATADDFVPDAADTSAAGNAAPLADVMGAVNDTTASAGTTAIDSPEGTTDETSPVDTTAVMVPTVAGTVQPVQDNPSNLPTPVPPPGDIVGDKTSVPTSNPKAAESPSCSLLRR